MTSELYATKFRYLALLERSEGSVSAMSRRRGFCQFWQHVGIGIRAACLAATSSHPRVSANVAATSSQKTTPRWTTPDDCRRWLAMLDARERALLEEAGKTRACQACKTPSPARADHCALTWLPSSERS